MTWVCSAEQAHHWSVLGKALLVDVRVVEDQMASGLPAGAMSMDWPSLRNQLDELITEYNKVLLLCAVGHESDDFCQLLDQAQYQGHVFSVAGGFDAWFLEDFPTETFQLSDEALRFDRQMRLPGVGQSGQARLKNSHVMLVGMGGLGVPALQYLAAAGVGKLTLVDDDEVSLSNLPRQVIYQTQQVGEAKVKAAAAWVACHNDAIDVVQVVQKFNRNNAPELLKGVDVVLDCSDNLSCRQTINHQCIQSQVPWIFAAVTDFEIQLSFFDAPDHKAPCFQCLFPDASSAGDRSCNAQGVLGMTPGVAGTLQAAEAIKYLLGLDGVLKARLLVDNLLTHQSKVLKYRARKQCPHHQRGNTT